MRSHACTRGCPLERKRRASCSRVAAVQFGHGPVLLPHLLSFAPALHARCCSSATPLLYEIVDWSDLHLVFGFHELAFNARDPGEELDSRPIPAWRLRCSSPNRRSSSRRPTRRNPRRLHWLTPPLKMRQQRRNCRTTPRRTRRAFLRTLA